MGRQPHYVHLQHNPYIEGSGNIMKEGKERMQEPGDQGICYENKTEVEFKTSSKATQWRLDHIELYNTQSEKQKKLQHQK